MAAADGVVTEPVLTNCDTCEHSDQEFCNAFPGLNAALRQWCDANIRGGAPVPNATGCPSHKARQ